MTNIFIDIPILEHQSHVVKGVFLVYHLTIESNIPLLHGSIESTLHILCFRPTKPKTFCLQCPSPQFFGGRRTRVMDKKKNIEI
jgi:hypothetical protein